VVVVVSDVVVATSGVEPSEDAEAAVAVTPGEAVEVDVSMMTALVLVAGRPVWRLCLLVTERISHP
jgi:hypothetical protein